MGYEVVWVPGRRRYSYMPCNPECFEDSPLIRETEKYKTNGRCPLYIETGEPYRHIDIDGVRYWIRPDLADRNQHGELPRCEIDEMLADCAAARPVPQPGGNDLTA